MLSKQEMVIDLLRREPKIGPRRVAGEFGWRSQDAGRVLHALERQGIVEFYIAPDSYQPSGYRLKENS